ncbi:glycoside hydrolase superfamily [Aspergillus filifer]
MDPTAPVTRGALLPSATATGATFDTALMRLVGRMLALETKEKGCQVLLAPTVCLQRSPLIGRGFEAFGKDPILSGIMASDYIIGVQEGGVAVLLKHYVAHDQSSDSPEDGIRAFERTLRETHLLPFQLAVKHANPWSFMSAYYRINGVHTSEDPWLNETLLREEWGWDGLIISDWFGTYSTSEAINAGLDLEMPGPTRWRGELLRLAIAARKVKVSTLNKRVRTLLNLVNKVRPALDFQTEQHDKVIIGDTAEKRGVCREVARSSISYGLIGPAVLHPAISGGGSANLVPYYVSKPVKAIQELVGADRVKTAVGCYGHLFTPLLSENIVAPGLTQPGYQLEWYGEDLEANSKATPIHTTIANQAQMYFADNLPAGVPGGYWLRVTMVYKAPKTMTAQFGLCVLGKGRMYIDGKESSMELTADVDVKAGKAYKVSVLLQNELVVAGAGALNAGGLRIGCCEKIDPKAALEEAVELAKTVDVPIILAGLNADYESEATDRKSLSLPPGVDELIKNVLEANPMTIIINQSGCPVTMPWIDSASTLVQAWLGGQETGNAITDVLFGRHNPTGRLSITFPRRLEDTPAFLTYGKGQREMYYGEGVFLGYRYYEKLDVAPLFYFGYGLSYTKFEYSNLCTPATLATAEQPLEISVNMTNTGAIDGHEIVQVYILDVECDAARPCKELKGFTKVWVAKGDTTTAKVVLDKYAMSYWHEEEEKWHAEKGIFKVIVSRSADPKDTVLNSDFELEKDLWWTGV